MEPDFTPLGFVLADRTGPMQPEEVDEQYGYAHANLCEALMRPFKQLGEVVDPPDPYPPWAPLFDLETCPDWALPWLAQVVGVQLPKSLTPEQQREFIRELSFEKVGTPGAIIAAAKLFLTDTQTVYFRERDPSGADPPYTLEVVTLSTETPDPTATARAIATQVPAGIVWSHSMVSSWDYQQNTTEGGLYSALATRFDNYSNYKENDRS